MIMQQLAEAAINFHFVVFKAVNMKLQTEAKQWQNLNSQYSFDNQSNFQYWSVFIYKTFFFVNFLPVTQVLFPRIFQKTKHNNPTTIIKSSQEKKN